MSVHRSGGLHPLLLIILGIPALLGLGVVKGCEMTQEGIRGVADEISVPPAVREPKPRHQSIKEGWNI